MTLQDEIARIAQAVQGVVDWEGETLSSQEEWEEGAKQILSLLYKEIEKCELSDEEIGDLEWNETPAYPNYSADFSFVDDYPQEVRVICQAQLQTILKALGG